MSVEMDVSSTPAEWRFLYALSAEELNVLLYGKVKCDNLFIQ